MTKDEHLNDSLESHALNKAEKLKQKFIEKKNELKETVEKYYGVKIYSPRDSGSYAKHTANNDKFDMDTIAPFKKDSFETLEDMFEDLYSFLKKEYEDKALATVRKQNVSVGITFKEDGEGDSIKLDVVAGRELKSEQYEKDGNLNLYVNGKYGELDTYIQTNIDKQIENIKGRSEERNVIRLLKIWRNNKCSSDESYKSYKSFLLELTTIKAFDNGVTEKGLWEQLKKVLEFIRDNIENISLVDPGNSNNDVLKSLTANEKQILADRADTIIKNIEKDENWIKHYFPINPKYPRVKDEVRYLEKANKATILPSVERFG